MKSKKKKVKIRVLLDVQVGGVEDPGYREVRVEKILEVSPHFRRKKIRETGNWLIL